MFYRLKAGMFAAAVLLLGAGTADCAGNRAIAVAARVTGDVKVTRAGTAEPAALQVSDSLYRGDSVATGPGAMVSLAMVYGAELRMNENTTVELVPGRRIGDFISLATGQVWTRLLHKKAELEIRSGTAICSVRGTQADIEQNRNNLTVKVYEGHVDVKNPAGTVSLKAGEVTRVSGPGSAPAAPVKMAAGQAGNWQERVTPQNIESVLEKLREAAGGDKKLELNVGQAGKGARDVRIKLKKVVKGKE